MGNSLQLFTFSRQLFHLQVLFLRGIYFNLLVYAQENTVYWIIFFNRDVVVFILNNLPIFQTHLKINCDNNN